MKVFAEWIKEGDFEFRKNTFLQFGRSWEHIGNVVLCNPGSAIPTRKTTNEVDKSLYEYFLRNHNVKIKTDLWYEFKENSTMRFVEKLFNGNFLRKNQNLNGVIQLFNLFNLKKSKFKSSTYAG